MAVAGGSALVVVSEVGFEGAFGHPSVGGGVAEHVGVQAGYRWGHHLAAALEHLLDPPGQQGALVLLG